MNVHTEWWLHITRERESMTTLFKSPTPFLRKTQTKPWYFLSWVCILAENQTFEWCCLIAEVLTYFFYSWFLSLLFKYRGLIFKADWQFDTTQCFIHIPSFLVLCHTNPIFLNINIPYKLSYFYESQNFFPCFDRHQNI